MIQVSLDDIEYALAFVSSDGYGDNAAAIDRNTGDIYYLGDDVDAELPDDFDKESESLAWVPNKYDLDLGSRLAIKFALEFYPDEYEEVRYIFSRRGAYAHFKRWLGRKNCLKQWHDFEQEQTRAALIAWCEANEIEPYIQLPRSEL